MSGTSGKPASIRWRGTSALAALTLAAGLTLPLNSPNRGPLRDADPAFRPQAGLAPAATAPAPASAIVKPGPERADGAATPADSGDGAAPRAMSATPDATPLGAGGAAAISGSDAVASAPVAPGPGANPAAGAGTAEAGANGAASTSGAAVRLPPGDALAAIDAAAKRAPAGTNRATTLAYAPAAAAPQLDAVTASVRRFAEPVDEPPLALDTDLLSAAVAAYRSGDQATGDRLARSLSTADFRLAAEWAALRTQGRQAGEARLRAFLDQHPSWPSRDWLERQLELALFTERPPAAQTFQAFAARAPLTLHGVVALARAEKESGREAAAIERVRRLWREETLTSWLEQAIQRDFGAALTADDRRRRADLLFYDGKTSASFAEAKAAGEDATKLALARAAAGSARFDKLVAALPKALQDDPSLAFARAQALERQNKIPDAAAALAKAPTNAEALVDGDAWWRLRRGLARKLLDKGDAQGAYRLAAAGGASSGAGQVEAAFMAGWIALRHLKGTKEDAARARGHFEAAANVATTPASKARAAYWRGRAAEALGDETAARGFYRSAAESGSTFYGQLAAARVGLERPTLRQAAPAQADTDFMRAFRSLYEADEKALALPLAIDAAKAGGRDGELAALADWIGRRRDARSSLLIGKAALVNGGALDETAFPTFGVPAFAPTAKAADAAIVYSIARQESAFQTSVVSHAGAKGLMQMMTTTARETARRAGLPFDEQRLIKDPAFNAQLGAAHLGELLTAQRGNYILAFAAYNAGPGRVKQWLDAYGDPRAPGVDPVDWIERIPIQETRDYVQKTIENLRVYRLRLGLADDLGDEADLKHGDGRRTLR